MTGDLQAVGGPLEPAADEPRELTADEQQAFLAYIGDHKDCSVREACEQVGLKRKDVRAWRRTHPEFDEDYKEARGYSRQQIRNTLRTLAIEGVEVPLTSAGQLVRNKDGEIVYVRERSARLLEFLARMELPEARALAMARYGIDINARVDGQVTVQGGVALADVAAVLAAAGALPAAAGAGRPVGGGDARPALPAAEGGNSDD